VVAAAAAWASPLVKTWRLDAASSKAAQKSTKKKEKTQLH